MWPLAAQVCTDRQLQVMRLAEQGMSQTAIAYHLGVARSTVRDHLREGWARVDRARKGAA